ncbi:ATP-binding cassette domain-containing protein, partial [Vibrio parahaemolyticus]|nr:ATP-binding cassette domain-containing protein [Vibrio parahaemolyticus]
MKENTPVVEFSDVNKWYGDYHALKDINFSVHSGEIVVVCGPSGSGKSTLIRCINHLESIQEGQLHVFDQPSHA